MADDKQFVQALTVWLETGRRWEAVTGSSGPNRTTGASTIAGSAISMLRPHPRNRDAWMAISDRAARVRILSCSTLEACLVAQGSTDAFLDAGSDTHRLVDLAAAAVLLPACGGVLTDVFERPIVFDLDQTRRWSGIAAASAALAAELAEVVRNSAGSLPSFT